MGLQRERIPSTRLPKYAFYSPHWIPRPSSSLPHHSTTFPTTPPENTGKIVFVANDLAPYDLCVEARETRNRFRGNVLLWSLITSLNSVCSHFSTVLSSSLPRWTEEPPISETDPEGDLLQVHTAVHR